MAATEDSDRRQLLEGKPATKPPGGEMGAEIHEAATYGADGQTTDAASIRESLVDEVGESTGFGVLRIILVGSLILALAATVLVSKNSFGPWNEGGTPNVEVEALPANINVDADAESSVEAAVGDNIVNGTTWEDVDAATRVTQDGMANQFIAFAGIGLGDNRGEAGAKEGGSGTHRRRRTSTKHAGTPGTREEDDGALRDGLGKWRKEEVGVKPGVGGDAGVRDGGGDPQRRSGKEGGGHGRRRHASSLAGRAGARE